MHVSSSQTLWTLPRRRALQIGGAGFFGLNMRRLLAAEEQVQKRIARAKSVIFLYQFGGPSHLDMFDRKPNAPDGIRSPLHGIDTAMPGLQICEELPETAKVMDKVTLLHSVTHSMKNHNSASYYALTGFAPPVDDIRLRDSIELSPAYGSTVDRFGPNTNGMPTFVAYPYVITDGSVTPGQRASFLGPKHDPLLVTRDPNEPDFQLPELSLPSGLSVDRLANRRGLQEVINSQLSDLDRTAAARGLDSYYEKALGMLNTTKVRDAFDLSREPASLRDRYGRTTYGQSCLLARRLVERGVKFVNVYFAQSIGGQSTTSGGWDTHGFNDTRMYPIIKEYHLPLTDHTLPVLLTDLDERGLLDETLVIWTGEFGRTPRINANISRDHWPFCYTVLLAGGGVKRGFRYGASDPHGAYPAGDAVRPEDLSATVYSLLGIDPHTEVRDPNDRPLAIAPGNVVEGIIA